MTTRPTDAPTSAPGSSSSHAGAVALFIFSVILLGIAIYVLKDSDRRDRIVSMFQASKAPPRFQYKKLGTTEMVDMDGDDDDDVVISDSDDSDEEANVGRKREVLVALSRK